MPSVPLPYSFVATVVHGDGYGHVLGYPTANVDPVLAGVADIGLRDGVYAGYVQTHMGERYKAGIVMGSEGNHGQPKIEAHLIGFNGDLYGRVIRFEIIQYLRAYQAFDRADDLVAQIGRDIEQIVILLP